MNRDELLNRIGSLVSEVDALRRFVLQDDKQDNKQGPIVFDIPLTAEQLAKRMDGREVRDMPLGEDVEAANAGLIIAWIDGHGDVLFDGVISTTVWRRDPFHYNVEIDQDGVIEPFAEEFYNRRASYTEAVAYQSRVNNSVWLRAECESECWSLHSWKGVEHPMFNLNLNGKHFSNGIVFKKSDLPVRKV